MQYLISSVFCYFSNLFRVFGCSEGSTEATTLEASKNPMRYILNSDTKTSLGSMRMVAIEVDPFWSRSIIKKTQHSVCHGFIMSTRKTLNEYFHAFFFFFRRQVQTPSRPRSLGTLPRVLRRGMPFTLDLMGIGWNYVLSVFRLHKFL